MIKKAGKVEYIYDVWLCWPDYAVSVVNALKEEITIWKKIDCWVFGSGFTG